MPLALILPIALRAASTLVFLVAVVVAGVMNRSIAIVPLLAIAATLTQLAVRRVAPSPIEGLQAAFQSPMGPPPHPAAKLLRSALTSTVAYGVLFGFSALIAAMFQVTEFSRIVTQFDFGLIAVPTVLAFLTGVLVAKTAASQAANMMGDLQQAFADMQAQQPGQPANDEEPFTFEGEIIDPDDRDL